MKENVRLSRSLSLTAVVVYGMAFMALTTVFSTYGIASQLSHGMVAGAYVLALIVMLFTAHSYGQMAKAYPVSGSAYTYAQKAINSHVGFLVGWAILMDYLFIPMVNFLLFGIFFSAAIPEIPSFVWILLLIVIVTFVNIKGVKLGANVNMIVIGLSLLFLAVFCVLSIKSILQGTGTGMLVNLEPFFRADESFKFIVAGAALLCFSFLGFDSVSTFSEEVKNPEKNIPRAIFLVTIIGGLCFITVSYIAHNIWPNYKGFTNADAAANEIILLVGGNALQAAFLAITALVVFGSASASQASAARVLYAMGRDGQLPKTFFGKLDEKTKTPVNNILLIGFLSLSALFLSLTFIASFINFGALLAFTAVNLSVIALYFIKRKERSFKGVIMYLIIPLIGASMTAWLLFNLDAYSKILGGIWFGIGMIYLFSMKKSFNKKALSLNLDEPV
ncbi:APC family permease [Sporosarcina pasteurii]|uniref:Putrescine importer PuuP n=1 Tax=Sporosarcina pasteurii TaxID=1474 RepID=A0A380CA30_SPOPA|nr:APC family permease [Sporosarcina pasteurii]MDS9472654.1 APC family permease [Sporosarcina pasteurii]QBQ04314.1 amino acid permease [Sporosarcina pasteurii]SUJ16071.1 Putrescine importer PuuP [Sporosarcina pasteurii]